MLPNQLEASGSLMRVKPPQVGGNFVIPNRIRSDSAQRSQPGLGALQYPSFGVAHCPYLSDLSQVLASSCKRNTEPMNWKASRHLAQNEMMS